MNKIYVTGNVVRDNDVKDTATTKVLKNTPQIRVKCRFGKAGLLSQGMYAIMIKG